MSKKYQYVGMYERFKVAYDLIMHVAEQNKAVSVVDFEEDADYREKLKAIFDFNNMTIREDVLNEVKKVVLKKILEINTTFASDSSEVQDALNSTIIYCIKWFKHRLESGVITWDGLMKRLQSIDLINSPFGIRVQHFGKAYFELFFNYVEYGEGVIKLYNADYPEDDYDDEVTVDTATKVVIVADGIKEIQMSECDLVPDCGLRDVTITFENEENVSLRFSDEMQK